MTGVVVNKNVLVSSSYDGTVRLWSLRSFSVLHIFEGNVYIEMFLVHPFYFIPDVKMLDIRLITTSRNLMILEPESLVRCLAFVGPMLACGDFGGSIHTWELEIASQPENTKKNPTFKVCIINRTLKENILSKNVE